MMLSTAAAFCLSFIFFSVLVTVHFPSVSRSHLNPTPISSTRVFITLMGIGVFNETLSPTLRALSLWVSDAVSLSVALLGSLSWLSFTSTPQPSSIEHAPTWSGKIARWSGRKFVAKKSNGVPLCTDPSGAAFRSMSRPVLNSIGVSASKLFRTLGSILRVDFTSNHASAFSFPSVNRARITTPSPRLLSTSGSRADTCTPLSTG